MFLLCAHLYKESHSTCSIAETISGSFWYMHAKGLVASHHEQIEILLFIGIFGGIITAEFRIQPLEIHFFWPPHSSAPWSASAISNCVSQLWTMPTETRGSCSFPVTRGSYVLFQVAIHILLVMSLHFFFFFSLYRLQGLFHHQEDFKEHIYSFLFYFWFLTSRKVNWNWLVLFADLPSTMKLETNEETLTFYCLL